MRGGLRCVRGAKEVSGAGSSCPGAQHAFCSCVDTRTGKQHVQGHAQGHDPGVSCGGSSLGPFRPQPTNKWPLHKCEGPGCRCFCCRAQGGRAVLTSLRLIWITQQKAGSYGASCALPLFAISATEIKLSRFLASRVKMLVQLDEQGFPTAGEPPLSGLP
jgi:hypothetical protein